MNSTSLNQKHDSFDIKNIKMLFIVMMANRIVEQIIVQFMDIVTDLAGKYHITIASNTLKLVSKTYYDDLVIDVFYQTKIRDLTDTFMPTPAISLEYTNVTEDDLENQEWINYLGKKAIELLGKISSIHNIRVYPL